MSDLMDKLAYLQETKALFKAKLGVANSVPFRDYVSAIPKATGWSQAAYEAAYKAIAMAKGWTVAA
jgi:hypothetical protein